MSLPAEKTPPLPSISSAPTLGLVARLSEGGDQRLVHRAGQRVLLLRPRQSDDEDGAVAAELRRIRSCASPRGWRRSRRAAPRPTQSSARDRARRSRAFRQRSGRGRCGRVRPACGQLRRGRPWRGRRRRAPGRTAADRASRRRAPRRGRRRARRRDRRSPVRARRPLRQAAPRSRRIRFARRRHLGDDRAHVGDFALQRRAARQRQLALHEVDRLDAVGALVDRGDARVAIMLRRAGLLDEAHAAMHLHAERGDLVADVGRERLGDRRQQRGALVRRLARSRCRRCDRAIDRDRGRIADAARGLGQRLHGERACAARRDAR